MNQIDLNKVAIITGGAQGFAIQWLRDFLNLS